jgi:hypothetical protein
MSKPNHVRRNLVVAIAAGGTTLAVGGAGLAVAEAHDRSQYDQAVQATWRLTTSSDLEPTSASRELVRCATLAANSHNTQPWRFQLSEGSILVQPDVHRRLTAVDPDDHHLFASLGCAVENMVTAAPALGLHATPSFRSDGPAIDVRLEGGPSAPTDLYRAIPLRQSTRSAFDGPSVPAEHLRLLEAAGNGDGVQMFLFTERNRREDLLAYLVAANSAQMDDAAFVGELRRWIRFNYAEAVSRRDGLFSKASGNPTLPSWLGRSIFRQVFTKDGENRKYRTDVRSSAGVAVFVSEANAPASWVAAGRHSQRFALQATALGLKHAYINQPVEVAAVRGQLATYLGVGNRRPDLVMRFGYGAAVPRSLRRPIEQVIDQT